MQLSLKTQEYSVVQTGRNIEFVPGLDVSGTLDHDVGMVFRLTGNLSAALSSRVMIRTLSNSRELSVGSCVSDSVTVSIPCYRHTILQI